jgi:geranylgeranyl diphosphate synthase type I
VPKAIDHTTEDLLRSGDAGDAGDAKELRERVQRSLADFLARRARQLGEIGPEMGEPVRAIGDLLASGKRLRPAFCYWGYRGAGGFDGDPIVVAAAALELLQASALIHDDVMDGSDMRRGMPAVHRRFAALHRESGWTGSPDGFGVAAAILLGDLCLSWCDEMLRSCGLSPERLGAGWPVYEAMRTEVIGGQYLDLVAQAARDGSVDHAMRVILFKTAKYSVERPLQLGGALGGASRDLLDAYSAFGIPLGQAFQLRDDILGVFGDPERTGKPAGDDLREGKRTVLVAKALQSAGPAERTAIERDLGDPDLDEDAVARLRQILVGTGAVDAVEKLIDELTTTARAALEAAPGLDPEAAAALHALAVAATRRTD